MRIEILRLVSTSGIPALLIHLASVAGRALCVNSTLPGLGTEGRHVSLGLGGQVAQVGGREECARPLWKVMA